MPTINRAEFYKRHRVRYGALTTSQVQGFEAIFNKWELLKYTDLRKLAYVVGTVWHETARTMQAIEEWGKGKGKPYGKKISYNGQPYTWPDELFYGRGLAMITWRENYDKMGRLIGKNLLEFPELALDLGVAVDILFEGMYKGDSNFGDFTGKSLEDYFNKTTDDSVNARRIINRMDKAETIAVYHRFFLSCLTLK